MTEDEMKLWLQLGNNINIQIPNEIFEDFNKANFKNFTHKCFAYAYYYLVTYVYRNALYGYDTEQYSQYQIIKTFTSNKSSVSYITKKGGLLDELRYTRTTTNYPIVYDMDNGILEFDFVKTLRMKVPSAKIDHGARFSIKEPIKAFRRFDEEEYTGTFYSFQNTHRIEINRFIEIVNDDQLGYIGLYVFGYLSMMCDRFQNGFQISNKKLSEALGCSNRTIQNHTLRLETIGVIKSCRKSKDGRLFEKMYFIKKN